MRKLLAGGTILIALFSGCGKLDCPSTFSGNGCGAPYGIACLTIDQYTSSGWNTCDDAKRCQLAPPQDTTACNPTAILKPGG